MKPDPTPIDELIERHLPSAPPHHVEAAGIRVWQRLSNANPSAATPLEARLHASALTAGRSAQRTIVSYAAVAALIVLAVGLAIRWPSAGVAVLEAADSSVYRLANGTTERLAPGQAIGRGEAVRADGGAVLRLADGSHVEMRSMSELSLERGDDGLGIRLRSGSIIVNAAMREAERLYVKTKDMTASVAGTVALVNAESDGSRVGVIEGEAQVREGTTETRLRPGQQVVTNRAAPPRPLSEEVGWSRQADPLRAILATFQKGMEISAGPMTKVVVPVPTLQGTGAAPASRGPGATQEFEEASVRPCDPDNIPEAPAGARGGGANSFQMTPGRTHALCMTLATLLRHAYGYGPADLEFLNPGGRGPGLALNNIYGLGIEDGKRVRGGPDWVRTDHYTIDAVAADAADAASMSGPMMRSLLEKRFQLKSHIETEQVPAWTLTVASGGLKIKPVTSDAVNASGFVSTAKDGGACDVPPTVAPSVPRMVRAAEPGERQPPLPSTPGQMVTILFRNFEDVRRGEKPTCGISMQQDGPNQVVVGGGVTLATLARSLASPLGGVIVTDKTGITDKFNIVLEYVRDENTPGPSFQQRPSQPDAPSDVTRGQTIFTALEEQLGLHLEPTRTPREFIVIDHVERPTAN